MKRYTTKDGYDVFFVSLNVRSSYEGLIIGSKETHSRHIKSDKVDFFSRWIDDGRNKKKPVYAIGYKGDVAPALCWICELESRKAVHTDDPDFNSYLYVCWFSEDTAAGIDQHIETVLKKVNWAKHAADYDVVFI